MEFDHNSSLPKYLQLQQILTRQIQSGEYKVGDKLSTDIELKKRYHLSTSTVARALYEMERAGFVTRKQGSGTFVSSITGSSPKSVELSDRVLFICGAMPFFNQPPENINWFIGHEIYRGLVNSFMGRIRIVSPTDIFVQIDAAPENSKFVALVNPNPNVLTELRKREAPYVIISQQQDQVARVAPDTINVNRLPGIYEAMTYLIEELGHRDIAFIGPGRQVLTNQHRTRWVGYVTGLQAFDIPVNHDLVGLAKVSTVAGGYAAMQGILQRKINFSAVFADTDIKAVGVIQALRDAGLKVPEDVSVVGFDDVPGMDQNVPPLTTVRMPYFEMGVAAVKLLEAPAGPDGARPGKTLPTTLVLRGSCAPAKTRTNAG
ncbi:MAG: substrate-binding domain-containing protein [Kiritimatiellia bacterium]|jgi:DNA-binding transcriptional regulator YhcF (GntR family)